MSAKTAGVSVLEGIMLGVINNVPICLAPTRPKPFYTQGRRAGEHFHGIGFHVVSEEGTPFTTADLQRMNLPATDAFGVRDFCESKLPLIFGAYFPHDVYDKNFLPGCCHLDESGNVHIIFNVTGSTK